ncbi:serine hydrolase domain-containing protein [Phreatobacter sp. AB_2022a]|uniref:serine hydrolase domain-containing protein n=1 Tax=Phreatobacter sp. AB_2022a TaxID=3003134 RepID=UPI002287307E|nr:serine hydrolase [Phreatobacter sp. AB_2022a]MCZ0733792.1 serine hydrolase [Phreatobacter sp. AB_2022a]
MTAEPNLYIPPRDGAEWADLAPAEAGFDPARLQAAIDFAKASESSWPRSLYYPDGRYVGIVEWNESGPWSEIAGPVRERGGPAGLVLKGGRRVAEWGETDRTDMTFSIAKSYLAVVAGLAFDDGLIRDVDEPVRATVDDAFFASPHNAPITWRHLLQQSSEWQGELFGKSDQVDHFRQIGPGADNSRKGEKRALNPAGTYYEYNDVRVNLLGYCLLQRFRRPLPEILRERVMDPIGASDRWEWQGYRNSWVDIDGRSMQSVPGGGHWGGGLFIGARDHARFGLMVARGGLWGSRRILSDAWVKAMLTPSPTLGNYGYLWWLNRGAAAKPDLPASVFSALGAGTNVIWADPDHDLVVVLRWIDKSAADGFFSRLVGALR